LFLWVKSVVTYNKLLNPLNFVNADYVRKRFMDTTNDIRMVEQLYQGLEHWRITFNLRTRHHLAIYGKQGVSQSVELISERAKNLIESSEDGRVSQLKCQLETELTSNDSIYFQVTSEIPQGAKPAFFEKVLIDFFGNYDQFEAENIQVGDPFGLNEVHSLAHFDK